MNEADVDERIEGPGEAHARRQADVKNGRDHGVDRNRGVEVVVGEDAVHKAGA